MWTIWLSGELAWVELCERCGALVVDPERHQRFHAQLALAPERIEDAQADDPSPPQPGP
jgi:hypothetical protein